jgi:alpha-tubulin suppressor-like RCC1 family protein
MATGSNSLFQLGLGRSVKSVDSPQAVLENAVEISAGNHSAAINLEGNLFLWGKGAFGSLDRPYMMQQKMKSISVNGSSGVGIDY